jgi:hypothetical protein
MTEYTLYGETIKVDELKTSKGKIELLTMEGLHYLRSKDQEKDKGIYVLQSILPESDLLIANEYHEGETNIIRISDYEFCERPN